MGDRAWVAGVSVVDADYGQLEGRDPERLLCLCVLMSDTTRIVIPMDASEIFGPPD
jgi:hypothetical protein